MKSISIPSILPTSLALALSLAGTAALAGGNHSGGHDHYSYGAPGVAAKVTRTIAVDAADTMRFTPSNIAVKKGETVRFVIRNAGAVAHEFSLGTQKELDEHYEVMKKFPNMEHDEPNKISLQPGAQGEIIWRFSKTGTVHFACLHIGHYDAGMKGQVKVAAK